MASGVELVEIAEAERLLAAGDEGAFSQRELAYARARVDPARRLAARLAAKRAACRLLGGRRRARGTSRSCAGSYGPPALRLSGAARDRLRGPRRRRGRSSA